jgi:serine/threonine-protein kinase
MNLPGLTDSIAGVSESPAKCRQCGTTTRLGNGLCLRCTLREGLDLDREASLESFEAVLAEDEVHDTHWRLGNYEILEEIGRGGMGVIYRARQRHSRRIVALKRMVSYHADSRETRERFRREAEAAASLDHPNILPIHEVGHGEDGLPFFSMKYAAGGSLQKTGPALRSDPRQSVQLMAKVARAVQYAHEHGILHRDLKPGNILLDGRGEPFVADFGLAKWLDTGTDLTRTLTIFGTPGYIAPEQAKGPAAKLTPAADVYSLGAILFDLLTGRPPFLGEHALAVIQQASEKPAPKLRSLSRSGGIDRDLETICARCLEREPQARYRSAGDLAVDLERWVEGRPIIARRVLPPVRAWRWSRRNPVLAGAAVVCALLVSAVSWLLQERSLISPFVPAPEKSIAVLPFENLSEEKANAFFADGVQDELVTDLSRIADLKVTSRASVMHFKSDIPRDLREIGHQLGVATVLEGSVQRSGNRVRVNAQLVDARTDRHLWAKTYDRDLADVFAIESELAKTIADQLQAKLSPDESRAIELAPTNDLTAFDLYTRAKDLSSRLGSITGNERTSNLRAVDLLNQAVARDPSFFDAYCQLAQVHDALYVLGYDHISARLALADAAVEAASRLRPDAGETHLARAQNLYQGYLDYAGALAELELARPSLPNDSRVFLWKGLIERRQGRLEDSTRNLERAIELDPRNFFLLDQTAQTYQALRRYVEEKATYDRILTIEPNDPVAKVTHALIELNCKADARSAREMIESIRATNPAVTPSVADAWLLCSVAARDSVAANNALIAVGENPINLASVDNARFSRQFLEGVIARMTKDENKAQSAFTAARAEQEKIVQAQANYGLPLCVLGLIDAGLGRKEEALREGRRAIQLVPPEKDALDGSAEIKYFAMIAAWVGEKDLAFEQLATAIRTPSGLSYGQLKLLPFWDPLRDDPRFEKLLEEAKKPIELK